MKYLVAALFLVLLVPGQNLKAQSDTSQNPEVVVEGVVINEHGDQSFSRLFVVNQRTRTGNFAESNGTFKIKIKKNDTLMIGAAGYRTKKISVADSAYKPLYRVTVALLPLVVELDPVDIFAPRALKDIYEDIEELGYDDKQHKLSGINAVQSPITALYMALSRKERRKREAYRIINEDRKRELLMELLQKYVDHDIIELSVDQFYDFISFCNVSDEFMKNTTQYEFIMYIKYKYRIYRRNTKYDDYYRED